MPKCEECGEEMQYKFSIRSIMHVTRVYQCHKCKTIDSKLENVEVDNQPIEVGETKLDG